MRRMSARAAQDAAAVPAGAVLLAAAVRLAGAVLLAAAVLLTSACATNPVTGRRELSLVSASQEVEIGREGARDIARSIGLYPDEGLQTYVADLGTRLAARSERPDLPWSFQIADDAAVNAFALPGGFIFVTRGMLAHMNSEAQLVAVLGHEIGHVTARHSVRQVSRAQLTQLGLGIGYIISDDVREYGALAAAGVGLLFLKFGRDDESQADELGFGYAMNGGYDPREMVPVFETLDRVSAGSGSERLPQWLSTHPNPEGRIGRTEERIRDAALPSSPSALRIGRNEYLRRLEGLTFGDDPRKGYFKGPVFHHPDLKFRLTFPDGWKTHNGAASVVAISPREQAAVELALAGDEAPEATAKKFLTGEGMVFGRVSTEPLNGLPAASARFELQGRGGRLAGRAVFVSLDGKTYRLLGYGSDENEPRHEDAMRDSLESFRRLTDRAALSVQAAKLKLVTLDRAMTVEEFHRRHPSTVPLEMVALINGRVTVERVPAGTRMKQVTGGTRPD